jgi:hypothetical protein
MLRIIIDENMLNLLEKAYSKNSASFDYFAARL